VNPETYCYGRPAPDYLDGDMTRAQFVDVLKALNFRRRDAVATLQLDKDARDYLLRLLRPAA
jgi:hypothetical protein